MSDNSIPAKNNFEITYGDVLDRFEYHFNLAHNKSILFSGKYGIGKSTFLKFYLDKQEDIVTIRLYPVNYAVSSNENIFELIKVDIIKQLFLNDLLNINSKEIQKSLLNTVKNATQYAKKHPTRIVKYISKSLSKLHPLFEVAEKGAEGINALIEDFSKFEEELDESNEDDSKKIQSYLDTKEDEIGSYLEFNLISQIIKSTIDTSKLKGKKFVLVIDDLDRLDPEHIFRILNIFSSHHDHDSQEHKFGFDKVIIVCDLDNIQKIFHHKYGLDVDFGGYIDKFYSDEIFSFTNNDAVDAYVFQLNLNWKSEDSILFREILSAFVNSGLITVRQLMKFRYIKEIEDYVFDEFDITELFSFQYIKEHINNRIHSDLIGFNASNIGCIFFIKYFSILFGSLKNFENSLRVLSDDDNLRFNFMETQNAKSLIIANRYFDDNDNKSRYNFCFRNIKGINHSDNDASDPIYAINGIGYELKLKWNSKSRYVTGYDYFENSQLLINERNKHIKMSLVVGIFRNLVEKAKHQRSFYKLGIVS